MANKIEEIAIQSWKDHNTKYQTRKEKWVELVKRYENEPRVGSITEETETKTKLGQAYALVENFISRIIAQAPQFNYLARERKDVDFVEQYKEFNEYQNQEANSREAFETIAKWGGICGFAGWKMGWKTEQILRKKKGKEVFGKVITDPTLVATMDALKMGKSVKVDDDETISNWTIDAVAPYDMIWNANATEVKDCFVLGHRVHNKTYGMLKEEGYDMTKVSNRIKDDANYWKGLIEENEGLSTNKILENVQIELAELYIKHLKKGVWENWVVTLVDVSDNAYGGQPMVIRQESNPFDKQFVPMGVFRPIKRPERMYGFGIIEPVLGVLNNEEDTLNMVAEAFWTDVSRPMEYNPSNVLVEAAFEFKPRTLIPVRRLGESVAVLPTPQPNMGSASFILGYMEKTKQNVTAITDYQTGANQVSREQTATEVKTKTFLSEQRTNKILQRFETDVLEPAGKMALWLNKQYLADQKKIIYRVLGTKGKMMEKDIKLKDIEAIKDVVIVSGSSSYLDASEEIAKWSNLLFMSNNELQFGPMGVPMDREYIWKKLLEDGYKIKDPDNLIPSLKEREEESVGNKQAQLKDAKEENLDPASARVLGTDNHEIHLKIHQAAVRNKGVEGTQYTPEQEAMLHEHINRHTEMAGGQNPSFAGAREQQVANQITQPNGQAPSNGASSGTGSQPQPTR